VLENSPLIGDVLFGGRVAISSNELFVSSGENGGTVALFGHDGATWVREGQLLAPDSSESYPGCGRAGLALSGDSLTVTCHRLSTATDFETGLVRRFGYESGAWRETALIRPPTDVANLQFGRGGAEQANDFMIVGVPSLEELRGGAMLYQQVGSEWLYQKTVHVGQPGEESGLSVAISDSYYAVGNQGQNDFAGVVFVESLPPP